MTTEATGTSLTQPEGDNNTMAATDGDGPDAVKGSGNVEGGDGNELKEKDDDDNDDDYVAAGSLDWYA